MLDPFAGSGTTLVESLESDRDAAGGDIAAFNCLLMRVKTARYNEFTLERELREPVPGWRPVDGARPPSTAYVDEWFAPRAPAELLPWRRSSTPPSTPT